MRIKNWPRNREFLLTVMILGTVMTFVLTEWYLYYQLHEKAHTLQRTSKQLSVILKTSLTVQLEQINVLSSHWIEHDPNLTNLYDRLESNLNNGMVAVVKFVGIHPEKNWEVIASSAKSEDYKNWQPDPYLMSEMYHSNNDFNWTCIDSIKTTTVHIECTFPAFYKGNHHGNLLILIDHPSLAKAPSLQPWLEQFEFAFQSTESASVLSQNMGVWGQTYSWIKGCDTKSLNFSTINLITCFRGFDLPWIISIGVFIGFSLLGGLIWALKIQFKSNRLRRIANTNLKAEQERLNQIIAASVQGMVVYCEGSILFANQSFLMMTGYQSLGQVVGMNLSQIFPEVNHNVHIDILMQQNSQPDSEEPRNEKGDYTLDDFEEWTGKRADGSTFWAQCKYAYMHWTNGYAILCTMVDITHLRQSEARVLEQQHLLQSVIDHLPFWIYLRDASGDVQFMNRHMSTDLASLSNQHTSDVQNIASGTSEGKSTLLKIKKMLPELFHLMNDLDDKLIESKIRVEDEYDLQFTQDQKTLHHVVKIPVWQEDQPDQLQSILSYSQDITHQREHERALIEGEDRYRSLFEATFEGLVILEHDRILVANTPFAEMLQVSLQTLSGTKLSDYIVPEYHMALNDAKQNGGMTQHEVEMILPDTGRIDVEMLFRPHFYGGRRVEVAAIRDIRERKRMERLIKQFVSLVSHELRTPLTSIRGSLGLLVGGMCGDLPKESHQLLVIAENNCQRLIRLTNDILDVEKIESGKVPFQNKRIDLILLTKKTLSEVQSYGIEFDVQVVMESNVDECMVYVDSDRITQAITNLVSNAVKFSPTGDLVNVKIEVDGDQVWIKVSDNGIGIPDSFKSRIFSPFAQADLSDARAKGGSGLGLNIAKHIVERSGGKISFCDNEPQGTTFYFNLPLPNKNEIDSNNPQNNNGKH